jgi:hypothetical protein
MSFEYIRNYYKVPAMTNARIKFTWCGERFGKIVGTEGHHLKVHFDDDKKTVFHILHPTWEVEYLEPDRVPNKPREQPNCPLCGRFTTKDEGSLWACGCDSVVVPSRRE